MTLVTADDPSLVERCRDGDEAAWKELVARYGRLVYSIPSRCGLGESDCDDVFQEVFAVLVRQLPRLRDESSLPKWFITTSTRIARKTARRNARASNLSDPDSVGTVPEPEDAIAWERRHLVRQALRELGGPCEELLTTLFARDTVRYSEVAETLGMPIGSIGPTRARCLRKLLEILHRGDPPG